MAKRLRRENYLLAQQNSPDGGVPELPQKKFYRQRAHANPFSDHKLVYPASPDTMNWSSLYPDFFASTDAPADGTNPPPRQVEVADIGCGFGGLLVGLAPVMPDKLILGLEIRDHVTEFVQNRIHALRAQNRLPLPEDTTAANAATAVHPFSNIACVRANTMKFLPNFFRKAQLTKIFLCFPDPHFKARKHKARIVSPTLSAEYAFVLRPHEGRVYTITDVEDLHLWMVAHFAAHPSFARVPPEEEDVGTTTDPCVKTMSTATEEGKKVERNKGPKYIAVFRRIADPPWPGEEDEGTESES